MIVAARLPAITSSLCHYPCRALSSLRLFHCSTSLGEPENTVVCGYGLNKNDARFWDRFYKRHQNKFFKDRHYLEKDWGNYFSDEDGKVVLEVGCGAGNTIFPLMAMHPKLYIHACDFSHHAVALVKSHEDFVEEQMNVFVCDVTDDDLSKKIALSSVDVVTLIFVLSAVSPKKMHLILQNIKRIMKPNGNILIRDYAVGDFSQVKLQERNQMIEENFYVRGDGTYSYYFSEDSLSYLFTEAGFGTVDINIYCKQIENRSRSIIMDRRWIRAIFRSLDGKTGQLSQSRSRRCQVILMMKNLFGQFDMRSFLQCEAAVSLLTRTGLSFRPLVSIPVILSYQI